MVISRSWPCVCAYVCALQIEQRMATRILDEEERRMYTEMNEQERIKSEQR